MAKKFTLFKNGITGAILIGSLFIGKIHAQVWTKMDLSGLEMRSGEGYSQAAFSIDKGLYIVGGKQGNTVKATVFRYNPAHENGSTLPDFYGGARYNALGFSVNGKGYILGGIDAADVFKKDVWEYDPSGTWTKKADFPGGERAGAVAFVIDNKAYVGTGKNATSFFNDLWEYTPSTDTWVQKNNLPASARAEAVGFSADQKGFIGTGITSSSVVNNDLWEYTPTSNSWVQKNNFPGAARASAVGFNMLGKGYISTGNDASTYYKDFWEYTASSDSWIKLADFPGVERHEACAVAVGARACIVSGENASGNLENNGYYYKHKYTYGFTVTPSVVCVGSKVVLKNITTDPDAYSYRWEIFTSPPYNRTTILTDTIQYIPTKADLGSSIMLTVKEENGWLDLGHANQNLRITNIDSVTIAVTADTCTGGVGTAIARPYSENAGPPYKYAWSNGVTHDTAYYMDKISGLKPGPISITITDAGGCKVSKSATIDSFKDKPVAILTTVPDTCLGHVGQVAAYPQTIKLPYTYAWSNGKTTSSVSNLSAGKYVVTLTDKNGCTAKDSIEVLQYKDTVKLTLTTPAADTCLAKTGLVKSSIYGGRVPYTYAWSNAKTTAIISNLVSGDYWVTVTDRNGCFAKDTATVKAHYDSVKVTTTSVDASCHTSNGSLTASPSNGTIPYTYLWSTGATTKTIDQLPAGTVALEVKDKYGCRVSVNALVKTSPNAAVPSICMVTVDSSSKYNVIHWEKTNYTAVDSFIVYREVSTNTYKRIGAVPYSAFSSFVDKERTKYFPNTGDPNSGTYRYKLQIRDECGYYSALSAFHNTIFIVNNNGAFSWPQLYTIEGSANPVNSYVLMRDDNSNGNWNAVNSVSGTQQLVTDPAYNAFKNTASYRVQTLWNISCTPSFLTEEQRTGNYTVSLSNIHGKTILTSVHTNGPDNLSVAIYPNPFNSEANLEISGLTGTTDVELRWRDCLGKQVHSQQLGNGIHKLDRAGLPSGMYFMEIVEQGKIRTTKKIVIND